MSRKGFAALTAARLPVRLHVGQEGEIVIISPEQYEHLLACEQRLMEVRDRVLPDVEPSGRGYDAGRSGTSVAKRRLNAAAMRLALKQADLTQRQLSDLLGVHETMVSKMMRGKRKTPDMIHAIAKHLSADPESLLEPDIPEESEQLH